MNLRQFLSLLCFLSASVILAQKPKLPDDVKTHIEQRLEYGMNPSIIVGMVEGDRTAFYCFGKTREGGAKADHHSIYEIGSISKTFTAVLLADQVLKGSMKLDDPVQLYLPSDVLMPTYESANITLGQLSDHTSSLPRLPSNMVPADPMNPYADYTVENMYGFLSGAKLSRPIGSKYEYSNLAVGLLGHVIARKAGKSYERLLGEVITGPLQMTETGITLNAEMKKQLAIGHANGSEVSNWDLPSLMGAGAIRSSAHDMILYLKANMQPDATGLSKAMQLTHQARHDKANGNSVGLGWHIAPGDPNEIVWHNGGTGGYRSFAGFDAKNKRGVVVLTNSDQGVDEIGFHLLVPSSPLSSVTPSIAMKLREIIDRDGAEGLYAKFLSLRQGGEYDVDEDDINQLGYHYLGLRKIDIARTLFAINMTEFPASFNVYDSYGEALMEIGQLDSAKYFYLKSLEIDPGNMNGIDMLAKMGVEYKADAVEVSEALLDSYTGTYELAPGFTIDIRRRGVQLFGQATGQDEFELFPKSENEFYLKVTPASAVFTKEGDGKWLMTWIQGGQSIPCKKLD